MKTKREIITTKPLGFRRNKDSHKLEIFDRNERTVATIEEADGEAALLYAQILSVAPQLYKSLLYMFKSQGLDYKLIAGIGHVDPEVCRAATALIRAEDRGIVNVFDPEEGLKAGEVH